MNISRLIARLIAILICVGSSSAQAGWFFGTPDLRDPERYAFVPSNSQPNIVAIDLEKGKQTAVIELPHIPGEIVVSKMLGMLFAANPETGTLTPVMLETQQVGPAFDVGVKPDHALLGKEDQFAVFWSNEGDLVVWDLKNIEAIYRNSGFQPGAQISFSVNGRGLYIVEGERNQMIVVDLEENKIAKVVPLGLDEPSGELSAVTRSMDGGEGYISVTDQNKLLILDLKKLEVKATKATLQGPMRPYSTGDGRYTMVPNRDARMITIMDATSHEVLRNVGVDVTPTEINTGWFDTRAYIMSETDDAIDVIDLDSLSRLASLDLPAPGDKGIVSLDMRTLATAIAEDGKVVLVDAARASVRKTIDVSIANIAGIQVGVSNNICH